MNPDFSILSFEGNPLNNPDFALVKQAIYNLDQMEWKKNEDIPAYYLKHYWIVFQGKQPVARACLYVNPELKWEQKHVPCIGNFECIRNMETAKKLLAAIEQYAYSMGFPGIVGPMNGSTFNQYRFPTSGIDSPFFSEDYYPDYYYYFWEDCGYKNISNYLSCQAKLNFDVSDQSFLTTLKNPAGNINFRPVSLENFEKELKEIHALVTKSFVTNKFYTPITQENFLNQYLPFKKHINPDFFWLAEQSGSTLAIIYCLPDYYSKKRLIIKTILVDPAFRRLGIMQQLGKIIYKMADEHQYTSVIHAYMQEQNGSVSLSEKFGGKSIRSYALYGKHLSP